MRCSVAAKVGGGGAPVGGGVSVKCWEEGEGGF